jgi:hypothetical protein
MFRGTFLTFCFPCYLQFQQAKQSEVYNLPLIDNCIYVEELLLVTLCLQNMFWFVKGFSSELNFYFASQEIKKDTNYKSNWCWNEIATKFVSE